MMDRVRNEVGKKITGEVGKAFFLLNLKYSFENKVST